MDGIRLSLPSVGPPAPLMPDHELMSSSSITTTITHLEATRKRERFLVVTAFFFFSAPRLTLVLGTQLRTCSTTMDICRKFEWRSSTVRSVDVHPIEPWVLVALDSGNVAVWHYIDKLLIKDIKVSSSSVFSAKFIVEKNIIVADADLVFICGYNCSTWTRITTFQAHSDKITSLSVLRSQQYLFSASDDALIKIWSYADWTLIRTFHGHSAAITHISISPIGNIFASGCQDGSSKVWSLDSMSLMLTLDAHNQAINWVGFLIADNKSYLMTCSADYTVQVWDCQTKKCVRVLYHSCSVSTVCFCPDPPVLITGSEDGEINMWNYRSFRLIRKVNYGLKGVCAIDLMTHSKNLAVGYEEGFVVIKLKREFAVPSMDSAGNILWEKNNLIQTININTNVADLEVANGEILSFPVNDVMKCDLCPEMIRHSPNGKLLVLGGEDNYIIYSAASVKEKLSGSALDFVWSAGGEFAIRENSAIKIFSKSFRVRKTFKPEFSPDCIFGGVLLSASTMNLICFYDWNNCQLVHHFGVDMNVRSVHWAEGNSLIAVNSDARFYILNYKKDVGTSALQPRVELLGTVNERVRTAAWARNSYVYINSSWCLKCCRNGNVTEMYILNDMHRLPRSMALIGYHTKNNKIYLADKDMNFLSFRVDHVSNKSIIPVASLPEKTGLAEVRERLNGGEDFEFSWKEQLLNGQYILPAVRDQGEGSTCVFQSVCAAAEMEQLKTAAQENPPRTTDIRFSASSFVADYEKLAGPIPLDSETRRLRDGLDLFESQGVHAEGGGVAPGRHKISSSRFNLPMLFEETAELITEGRPVLGAIRVEIDFAKLRPKQIYDRSWKKVPGDEAKTFKHCVLLVGFGRRAGRMYFVFLNSHGTSFGEDGFGRVYSDHVKYLSTLEF